MYIQYATCAEHPFKIVFLCRSRLPDVRVWRALEEPSRGPTQVLRDWSRTSEERRRHESSRRRGTFNSVWFIPDHRSSVSSSVSIDCCSRRGDLRAEEAEVFLQARLAICGFRQDVWHGHVCPFYHVVGPALMWPPSPTNAIDGALLLVLHRLCKGCQKTVNFRRWTLAKEYFEDFDL